MPDQNTPNNTTTPPAAANPATPVQDDLLFYNIMPKKTSGNIVPPKLVVSQQAQPEIEPEKGVNLNKYKIPIIIGIVVLVLCVGGWFLYEQHVSDESLIPVQLTAHTAVKATSTTPSVTPAPSVTTSSAWQLKYFGNVTCQDVSICGDNADPDHDGLTNIQEYKIGTDPNNPDSDGDGISDGDEVNVFKSNPLKSYTFSDPKYSDSDDLKAGYDPTTEKKYTPLQLQQIIAAMQKYGLHEPTIRTLGDVLINTYNFSDQPVISQPNPTPVISTTASSTLLNIDNSAQAQSNRDYQRSSTINTISLALLKYQQKNGSYPETSDFMEMYTAVKPYNLIATNPVDPINQPPYVYGYTSKPDGSDFTLSFHSETQNQLIQVTSKDAEANQKKQQADEDDQQRESDLESLRSALLLYSNDTITANQTYIFPSLSKYKSALVSKNYINQIPKDPVTGQDYNYEVSSNLSSFTLSTALQDPPTGNTGYECTEQEDCHYY